MERCRLKSGGFTPRFALLGGHLIRRGTHAQQATLSVRAYNVCYFMFFSSRWDVAQIFSDRGFRRPAFTPSPSGSRDTRSGKRFLDDAAGGRRRRRRNVGMFVRAGGAGRRRTGPRLEVDDEPRQLNEVR